MDVRLPHSLRSFAKTSVRSFALRAQDDNVLRVQDDGRAMCVRMTMLFNASEDDTVTCNLSFV